MVLAYIEEQDGNPDRAAVLYQEIANSGVRSAIPLLALARLAQQRDRKQEMVGWLELARQRVPEDNKSRLLLADHYLRERQSLKAELLVKEAGKYDPDNPEFLALQGRVMMAGRRYNEALSPLGDLVARMPDSAYARTLFGEALLQLGRNKAGREQLEMALKIQPSYVAALVLMANMEMQTHNYERALAYSRQIQQAEPAQYVGYELAGTVWMARENYPEAAAAYAQAWEHGQTPGLAIRFSEALSRSGNADGAIRPLLAWLDGNPGDVRVRQYLGTVYQASGQKDKALQEYEKVLAVEPDNRIALNNTALLYLPVDLTRAQALAEQAYQASPDNPGIQDTYGWILLQSGKLEQGLSLLNRAMEQLSDSPEVRYHHAVALYRSGDRKKARQLLEKLVNQGETFEGYADAQRLLGEH
jgi:putative PEP-CTERM system TPR-repeat lipoprotein